MSLNLYGTRRSHEEGAYRAKDFFSIERKESTKNTTGNNFLSILDVCFESYLSGAPETQADILWLKEVFEAHSFRKLMMKIVGTEVDEIIGDRTIPLTDKQIQELLVVLQNAIDEYGEKKKISHKNTPKGFSPLGYALHQLINEQNRTIDHELTPSWHTQVCNKIRGFFSHFLANYFFTKSKAAQEVEKKTTELQDTIQKSNELMVVLFSIVSFIQDKKKQQEYAQILFHVQENKDNLISMQDISRLLSELHNKIDIIDDDGDVEQNTIFLEHIGTTFIDQHFAAFKSYVSDDPLFRREIFDKKCFFIHKENFFYKDDDTLVVGEPLEECLGIEGFELPRESWDVKDATLFNALGDKVWRGDFSLNTDVRSLSGTYYILSQQDGYFTDKEHIDKSEKIDVVGFGRHEPLRLTIDFMRYKALYRIHEGKIEKNTTKEDI